MKDNQPNKIAYHPPVFSNYGNISNLTQQGSAGNPGDSAGMGNTMSRAGR